MSTTTTSEFSDKRFASKLARYAGRAGKTLVRHALELFYAMKAPGTPAWAKTVIAGALAYFILPTDLIPDFIPVAGLTDDLGALTAAVATVKLYMTDDVRQRARHHMQRWFGDDATTA